MAKEIHLQLNSWADDVRQAVNDFVDTYGINSEKYSKDSYAVFDFDNTTCIFDVQDQCIIYQLETMSFPLNPDEFRQALKGGTAEKFEGLIDDAMNAYDYLYKAYGPFGFEADCDAQQQILNDPYWAEFASKMGYLSKEIPKELDNWKLRWLSGLSEDQVYRLCCDSCKKYSSVDTFRFTATGPENLNSNTGPMTFEFVCGLTVTENTRELWKVLSENGIDVWVCSSSELNQIKAAVDFFGLGKYCRGVVAKTMKRNESGILLPEYDYENGYGYLTTNSGWEKDVYPVHASCRDRGKVEAINNAIAVHYHGSGPIAGFMDSTGDFYFCTEYDNTKLVICYNRGDRTINDGGGLISVLAVYQRDVLMYDFKEADRQNDTLYLLQGRDENLKRCFRNSNSSIIFGESTEKLFADIRSDEALKAFKEKKLSSKDIISSFKH